MLLNLLGTTTSALNFLEGHFVTLVKLLIVAWFVLLGIGFGKAPTRSTVERAKEAMEETPGVAAQGLAVNAFTPGGETSTPA